MVKTKFFKSLMSIFPSSLDSTLETNSAKFPSPTSFLISEAVTVPLPSLSKLLNTDSSFSTAKFFLLLETAAKNSK